nr:ribonuclease H-like domain-containing protein [Tanacetum cinerariifolium]
MWILLLHLVLGIKCSKEIWLGLILYRTPWTIKGVLSLDLSKVTITLQAKAVDSSFRIQQVAPPEETAKDKGLAGEVSASTKKKGRTVSITAEDMQKRKNDVKAKTTLMLALPDEHQLRLNKYDSAKELWEAILKTFGGNEATKKTKKNQLKECISPRSQDRGKRESYKKDPKVEDLIPKAMIAIDGIGWDWSYMAKEDEASKNHALVADEEEGIPQNNIDDKGYWDSGCSRHMTGNISYLSEYEPFNGGYVSFGHERGKITGKGSIKTDKLEFENVYFVEELKYNQMSMSTRSI